MFGNDSLWAIGYIMRNFKYDAAPLVLALVLSPMMENSLRQALLVSQGSFLIFFTRPISAVILIATLILLIVPYFLGRKPENGDPFAG